MRTHALVFVFCAAVAVQAQDAGASGVIVGANYQGSTNSYGAVSRIDLSGGYFFESHWQIELGIPFYVVSPSDSAAAAGAASARGIGNVYAQVRFLLAGAALNYVSTLTATAPTGDPAQGLSTGRVTVDWGHYFDRGFGRFTPFGEIGVANSVSDTSFFVRPYTTLGFLVRGHAGARYHLAPWATFGASGYVIEPAGGQTVISRVVRRRVMPPQGPAANLPGVGAVLRLRKPVFEETAVTTGTARIARDRGFSTLLWFGKNPGLSLHVGFTRSVPFDLNTVFFGVGYNLRKMLGGI